jgi:hypothetical protein
LQPGQEALTPEQEAEAERFADERIAAQLASAPVDEPETEALLTQAYAVAGLPPPRRIRWVDGPGAFAAALAPHKGQASVWHTVWQRAWAQTYDSVSKSVGNRVRGRVSQIVETREGAGRGQGGGERLGGLPLQPL